MKVLCVAEKPSIAKSITQILSGGHFTSRNTGTPYIKNYDFSYRLPPSPAHHDFVVTAVAGHLTEIHLPENTKGWQSCDPFTLFDAPVTRAVNADHRAIERNLLQEARGAQQLMIWTDCDREGEHIGSEIVSVCRRANPNLTIKRARFSAIIATQIHAACRNPVELDMRQADAVEARTELDLRVGAAMTRLQSLGLQAAFGDLDGNVVSYGPCQFPTLGFVVEQYERAQRFVPEPFWYISVSLEREESTVDFSWKRNRLFDHEATFVLYELCIESPEATVVGVQTKPTSKWKPLPLTTVELQKSGSRLLHLTPKRILDIAESLYQKGFLSYPRTETDQYDPQFNFLELVEKHVNDTEWGDFASSLMQGGFEKPRNGKRNDKAHPPIHPTAHVGNLNGDDKRVYELVTRRFLASCSKNATGRQTSVDIRIADEFFSASGLVILERNYLDVYPYDRWTGTHLPDFSVGETFMPSACEMKEGTTTRPSLLTEADLVNLMDKNGIGTDATIAEHIAKIIDREYVMKQREGRTEYLVPSTLGIGLVEGYNDIGFQRSLSKPHLRRQTEQRMTAICDGQTSRRQVLDEALEEYRDMYMRTKVDFARLIAAVGKYLQGHNAGPENAAAREDHIHRHFDPSGSDDSDDNDDNAPPPAGNAQGRMRGRGRGRATTGPPRARGRGARSSVKRDRSALQPGGDATGRQPPSEVATGLVPHCRCNEPAVERTVTRETENKGRKFYACSKPRDDGSCGFFEWADEVLNGDAKIMPKKRPLASATNVVNRNVHSRTSYAQQQSGEDGEIRCQCDLVAAQHTVSKDGPNKGRVFFSCSKVSKASQCKFFQWSDGESAAPAPAPARIGGCFTCGSETHWSSACTVKAGANGTGHDRDNAGSNYTCYRCSEPGHLSSNCPNEGVRTRAPNTNAGNVCFTCNESGHFANACPQKGGSTSRGRRGVQRGRGGRGGGRGRGNERRLAVG